MEFTSPIRQLQAWDLSEVTETLVRAQEEAEAGRFVVGFVAYDASGAFDPALQVPGDGVEDVGARRVPLAWFGVFLECALVEEDPNNLGARAADAMTEGERSSWSCASDAFRHSEGVEKVLERIAAGEVYLVNLTTRFRRHWKRNEDPFDLYCQLVSHFRSGVHTFIDTEDWAVACGSPELFFELSASEISTRPMKGTSRRGRWSEEDAELSARLAGSAKEQAENVMVVDMVRNDIGRIASVGSVAVPSLFRLEAHPSLWQMTSTVTATLRDHVTIADIFAALFPSASVTGAPKVSAMATIADLEDSARSIYCGAVGFLRPTEAPTQSRHRVDARFAVAIRTAVIDKDSALVEYGAGGGITEGSIAGREWAEVVIKGTAATGPLPRSRSVGGLIETMGFDPQGEGGQIRNVDRHVGRLRRSAAFFGFPEPRGVERALDAALEGATNPLRVRMEFSRDGSWLVTTAPLEPSRQDSLLRLCVDRVPVDPLDVTLFHKTTDRQVYEQRSARHAAADDVILVNDRGEITETTRANLVVHLEGRWWTPPLSSGVLPGIERERLLASNAIAERVLTVTDLQSGHAVATISSLRGWRAAEVTERCECDAEGERRSEAICDAVVTSP